MKDLPEGDVDHRVDGLVVHVPDVPLAAVAPELGHGEEVGQVHELGDVVLVDDDVAGVAEGEDGVEDLVVLALVDAQVLAGRLVHLQLGVEPRTGEGVTFITSCSKTSMISRVTQITFRAKMIQVQQKNF